jgi:hypothetical protein
MAAHMPNLATVLVMALVWGQISNTVGSTASQHEIRVTLLTGERLSLERYRAAMAPDAVDWDGGGFYFTFFVENRPSAPIPPMLGEIRVTAGGRPYNDVVNATSSKPFAPSVIVRDVGDAIADDSRLRTHMPATRAGAVGSVLQVYVPGKAVMAGASGDVTLELCETHRPAADGTLRALSGPEMLKACLQFPFAFSALQ